MDKDANIQRRIIISSLGNEVPLAADGKRMPERREISVRWLSGTFLTGFTSSILMGVALLAGSHGHQQLAFPAEAYNARNELHPGTLLREKRLLGGNVVAMPTDRETMDVATVIHEGTKEIIRRQPFSHVKMQLAANYVTVETYPPFNPLTIFSSEDKTDETEASAGTSLFYGSPVETEVVLRASPFPLTKGAYTYASGMSAEEAEESVRSNGSLLIDGKAEVSGLAFIDPQRSDGGGHLDTTNLLSARVVEQNMSVSPSEPVSANTRDYADDVIPIRKYVTTVAAMIAVGYPEETATRMSKLLSTQIGSAELFKGDVLRIGVIQQGELVQPVRASIYRDGVHQTTIALDDHGHFVAGQEPMMIAAVEAAFDEGRASPSIASGRDLPRVYDGLYRAALSYGMTTDMTALLVKLLAGKVDLQAQLKPGDTVEAFFSAMDEHGKAGPNSELLYVDAKFGDTDTRFYRYTNPEDGTVDYYDEGGSSVRQFLLRTPVPNARITSSFGMRGHPILGRMILHSGTDFGAPKGTPIMSVGNGIVVKAGWSSSYGNQTIIRHANGYVSSYNHQNAIAKSVHEGGRVTQGQIIGYVGSTGQSTGAHLHYELIVNGTKVDPMKVRLPAGNPLEGTALARFEEERGRVDGLLHAGGA